MACPLSQNLRQRVVVAVLEGGLSNNKAAARFGIAISTANLWVRKYKATGSLAHGKIGGHKPTTLSGSHRDWLLDRCRSGVDFTLRGLVDEAPAATGSSEICAANAADKDRELVTHGEREIVADHDAEPTCTCAGGAALGAKGNDILNGGRRQGVGF